MDKMRIGIGLPMVMSVGAKVVPGLMALSFEVGKAGYELIIYSTDRMYPYHRSREHIINEALVGECHRLLFVDSDCVVQYKSFVRLMETMDDAKAVMVAGHSYRRGWPFTNVWSIDYGREKGVMQVDCKPNAVVPMEIHGAGFSCNLIDLEWVKEMIRPPYFTLGTEEEGGAAGEDWRFCKKIRDAGGRIMGDPRVRSGHEFGQLIVCDGNVETLRKEEIRKMLGDGDGEEERRGSHV